MRAVQHFDKVYLQRCRAMTADQIVAFLEDFRRLHGERPGPSKLISLKVPQDLLRAFRAQADLVGVRYQTQIKTLMRAWLTANRN